LDATKVEEITFAYFKNIFSTLAPTELEPAWQELMEFVTRRGA